MSMKYFSKFSLLLAGLFVLSVLFSCKSTPASMRYYTAKEKPSDKKRKEEQIQLQKGTKAYNKQSKKNKKEVQQNINKSTSMKKRHRKVTKNKRLKRNKKPDWRF